MSFRWGLAQQHSDVITGPSSFPLSFTFHPIGFIPELILLLLAEWLLQHPALHVSFLSRKEKSLFWPPNY